MDTTTYDICANDMNQLLKIFPEEIWVMITDYLTDNDDLLALSNSSSFFRNILLPRQPLFLFPMVWEVFEETFYKGCKKDYEDKFNEMDGLIFAREHTSICLSCGGLRTPRSYSEILKLRLVCQTWCSAIDNFYQNREHHYKIKGDIINRSEEDKDLLYDWNRCYLINQHVVGNFISHFSSGPIPGKNPFVSRTVTLFACEETFENFEYLQIDDLLKKFGSHIWYCTLSLYCNTQLTVPMYSRIREWLLLLPNLRALRLEYSTNDEDNVDFGSDELQSEVAFNPLPSFENLRFLRAGNLPSVVFNSIIRRNNHLSMLEIERNSTHKEYDFWNLRMPNLEHISVKIFTKEEFQQLETSQVRWPLTKLYLDCDKFFFVDWWRLFSLLCIKWKDTLTELMIRLPEARREKDEVRILRECSSLELPLVERLILTLPNISSLDFILPMKKTLELLQVHLNCDIARVEDASLPTEIEMKQKIEFLGFHKRLYESNIWRIFPELKAVEISESFNPKTRRNWLLNVESLKSWWKYMREDWQASRK